MSGSMYEIIAIAARYLFAALMVLIVIRAWKITLVDARRAAVLRRLSPETGVCGEFLIISGGGRVRDGMRFPVIREGMIGSASKADVRLRAPGVHRAHAYFELTKKGLKIRTHANARLFNSRGESRRELLLGDGAKITVGSVEMMLILTVAVDAPAETVRDGLFDIPDDSPALDPRPARPQPAPSEIPIRRDAARPPLYDQERSARPAAMRPLGDIPPAAEPDEVFIPRAPYARDAESAYAWRETVINETASRRTIVREAAPADLFMERPRTLRPESDDVWAEAAEQTGSRIPGWDDQWDEPPKKSASPRKHTDDPFDI